MKPDADQSHWNVSTTVQQQVGEHAVKIRVREAWYDLDVAEDIAYTILTFVNQERGASEAARSFSERSAAAHDEYKRRTRAAKGVTP